jgi:hypothetical protein
MLRRPIGKPVGFFVRAFGIGSPWGLEAKAVER